MNASVESQERWSRFYEEASAKSEDGERKLMRSAHVRLVREWVFMVSSTLVLVGLTSYFYSVLTR